MKRCLGILAAVVLLCSCGGAGAAGGPTDTITLHSEPALDGCVRWLGSTNYDGWYTGTSANIGDDAANVVTRCFVSFDMSSVPAGVQVVTATLRMFQNAVSSGDSYSEPPGTGLGWILVSNAAYDLTTSFEDLFNDCTTGTDIAIGPLSTSFSANTWHELDVTDSAVDEVQSYHNGRLQFRVFHHYENNGSAADFDGWNMGESPTNSPELVIQYR